METVKYCSPGVFQYTVFFTVQIAVKTHSLAGHRSEPMCGKRLKLLVALSCGQPHTKSENTHTQYVQVSYMAKLTLNVLLQVYVTNFESRMLYNLVVTHYAFNHVNKLNTYYIILCLITCSERIKKENINGMHCNYRSRYNAIITHPMKNSAMSPLPPPPPPLKWIYGPTE